jgi:hypothetical protein
MIASGVQPISTRPAGPIAPPAEVMAPAAYWLRDEERTWAPSPYRLEDDHLIWGPLWRYRSFPVPERLYLHELRRLDLQDESQLLDFCNQFGALGVHPDPDTAIHLDEVRRPASLVRTLTSIYHLHESGNLTHGAIQEWQWDTPWVEPPIDAVDGHSFLTMETNRLLSAVTPMVGFGNQKQTPFTLLDALVIQFFNDVADGVSYKTCANEPCQGLFVNQIDRKGQRHSRRNGTLYCSPRCARAQAQRNYRRRSNGQTKS